MVLLLSPLYCTSNIIIIYLIRGAEARASQKTMRVDKYELNVGAKSP